MDKTASETETSELGFDRRLGRRRGHTALPEDANAIRFEFDEDEPEAVVFNDLALPSALISWSWCQLKMLDDLLVAILVADQCGDADSAVARSVRTVIGPVLNALEFAEQRGYELQRGALPGQWAPANLGDAKSEGPGLTGDACACAD